jgi:hypothetical protein
MKVMGIFFYVVSVCFIEYAFIKNRRYILSVLVFLILLCLLLAYLASAD